MDRHEAFNRRAMALAAAAMYGGAALLGTVQSLIPGGEEFTVLTAFGALAVAAVIAIFGPRAPVWALAPLGPIGAALIAGTLATVEGVGDGAVLYIWPVLWTAYFFGWRGAIGIIAWIGLVHGLAVFTQPGVSLAIDRWLDVVLSSAIAAVLVAWLSERNAELVDELEGEARSDALTGMLNRRGFEERVRIEIARARREDSVVAVVSFDIDYFKRINDEWGHKAGDEVLAALGEIFRTRTREVDVAGRLGGEEFVVLMNGVGQAEASAYAESIRAAFSERGAAPVGRVTLSAGVACGPVSTPEATEDLIQRADSALYVAKAQGRDRTVAAPLNGGSVQLPNLVDTPD